MGYIDLSGFEKTPTKSDISIRIEHEQSTVKTTSDTLSALEYFKAANIPQLVHHHKTACAGLVTQLKELILIQREHIKELRRSLITKAYTLEKLFERATGENSSNRKLTRFAPAISFVNSRIIEIKACVKQLLDDHRTDVCSVCPFQWFWT